MILKPSPNVCVLLDRIVLIICVLFSDKLLFDESSSFLIFFIQISTNKILLRLMISGRTLPPFSPTKTQSISNFSSMK